MHVILSMKRKTPKSKKRCHLPKTCFRIWHQEVRGRVPHYSESAIRKSPPLMVCLLVVSVPAFFVSNRQHRLAELRKSLFKSWQMRGNLNFRRRVEVIIIMMRASRQSNKSSNNLGKVTIKLATPASRTIIAPTPSHRIVHLCSLLCSLVAFPLAIQN